MSNIFDSENLAVSPVAVENGKIENLSDKPNLKTVFGGDGMTATELKKAFDRIGVYIAIRLSNLLSALKSDEAGASLGIKDWSGESSTIKEMLQKLQTTKGASILGTGKVVDGEELNLQEVIDDLYKMIASYKLDDIYDIKTTLGYVRESGACENYQALENLVAKINDALEKLETLLAIDSTKTDSGRISSIEKSVSGIKSSLGKESGVATLDESGKLAQQLDAGKIVSGKLPLSVIPDAAFERTKVVASESEMYALTLADVQSGDLVVLRTTKNPDKWFKVVDDEKLAESAGYMEIIGGTTAIAQMAKEFDADYSGGNSIASRFSSIEGKGRTTENVKQNADKISTLENEITALKGIGFESGSVKQNADKIDELSSKFSTAENAIASLQSGKADKSSIRVLSCIHSKSGTVHTFTLSGCDFVEGATEYIVKAKMTADINAGDVFSLESGDVSHGGILPVTTDGEEYSVEFTSGIYPVMIFCVDLGGSEKHAFFKSGGGYKKKYASGVLTADNLYIPTSGIRRNYFAIPETLSFTPRIMYIHHINASSTMKDMNSTSYTYTLSDDIIICEVEKNVFATSNKSAIDAKNAPYEWYTCANSGYWASHDKGPLSAIWEAFE